MEFTHPKPQLCMSTATSHLASSFSRLLHPKMGKNQILTDSCLPFSLRDFQHFQQTEAHSPHVICCVLPQVQVALVNTCVTPHVDFQPAGFVILLVTARERTGELLLLSEVGSIMGEQCTHCDKRSFTAWGKKGNSTSARYKTPSGKPHSCLPPSFY